jgi:hypothetical protein
MELSAVVLVCVGIIVFLMQSAAIIYLVMRAPQQAGTPPAGSSSVKCSSPGGLDASPSSPAPPPQYDVDDFFPDPTGLAFRRRGPQTLWVSSGNKFHLGRSCAGSLTFPSTKQVPVRLNCMREGTVRLRRAMSRELVV